MIRLAISGHGGAGKDLAGEILREKTTLRYVAGTSMFAAGIVYDLWGKDHYGDPYTCWLDRRNNRGKWAELIGEYNKNDPIALYRDCLLEQDMLTGIRWRHEFKSVKEAGLCDLWIWIERDVTPDPTMEYTKEECDITIENNGSVHDLEQKIVALSKSLGILKELKPCTNGPAQNS